MRQIIYFLLIILLFISCQRNSGKRVGHKYDYFVEVVGITDGDTFKGLTQDKIEIIFRIHGIDAPEKKQPFSKKSKEYLSDLIYNKRVGIIVEKKRDGYGRPVVWVFTPDGRDVSAEMIKAGMAWHYKQYSNDEKYTLLEIEAKNSRVGLWHEHNIVEPWVYRENKEKEKTK